MHNYDVTVLTDHRYLKDSSDSYKHNVFYEDSLVLKALEQKGLKVTRKAWDDIDFNWAKTKAVLFRTTWDYFDRFQEFSNWLSKISKVTQLINSERLIRWNLDKHYLLDLEKNNIRIPKTEFVEIGTDITLKAIHNKLGWKEIVLKPCISGAARHTYKLNEENLAKHEAVFSKLIKQESMMLQPFQHHIVTEGELSLMVFNGKFTHAVLKKAKAGDFRVQDDFGGLVYDYSPTSKEIDFAEQAVTGCPELPIYARVDLFTDNDGHLAISELELIEPELWFRNHPKAASVLAEAVDNKLKILSI